VHVVPVVQGNGGAPDSIVGRLVVVIAVPAPIEAETVPLGIVQREFQGGRTVPPVPEGGHDGIWHGARIVAGAQPAHARTVEGRGDLHGIAGRLAVLVMQVADGAAGTPAVGVVPACRGVALVVVKIYPDHLKGRAALGKGLGNGQKENKNEKQQMFGHSMRFNFLKRTSCSLQGNSFKPQSLSQ